MIQIGMFLGWIQFIIFHNRDENENIYKKSITRCKRLGTTGYPTVCTII